MSAPTVYLHGFTGEAAGLEPFAEVYSEGEYYCINMPGFGGSAAPSGDASDIVDYSECVWREIRKHVPTGKVTLVGHSHGAMVGYVLSSRHATEIERLDLFCPVANPRPIPALASRFISFLIRLFPKKIVVGVLASNPVVDFVSRYSFRKEWSAETKQRIIAMRRQEAKFYGPVGFALLKHARHFSDRFADTKCIVPTRLCYAIDDNVASARDFKWFADRSNIVRQVAVTGGHLCIVAEAPRIAHVFSD